MMNKHSDEGSANMEAEVLLNKLMHLKRYETPDASRMVRNKQNIMRGVRQAQANQRQPLLDRLENSMPWFFAEPRYGIAALFIAFFGLQYAGINARQSATSTGIYTSSPHVASIDRQAASVETNRYPNLPGNYRLFADPEGDASVVPAGFEYKK